MSSKCLAVIWSPKLCKLRILSIIYWVLTLYLPLLQTVWVFTKKFDNGVTLEYCLAITVCLVMMLTHHYVSGRLNHNCRILVWQLLVEAEWHGVMYQWNCLRIQLSLCL